MLSKYLKKGAYNTFFYGISSVITRALTFAFLPYFLAKLSLEEFGIWDFYQMFFSLGTLFLATIANSSLMRFYIFYKDDEVKQGQSVGNALLFVLLSVCTMPIVYFAIRYLQIANDFALLTITSTSMYALFAVTVSYFRTTEQLWHYLLLFCGQNILMTIGSILGIKYGYGIHAFFYANIGSLLLFLPYFGYLLKKFHLFSWPLLKEQIKFCYPFILYGLIFTGFFSIDRFFIKYHAGFELLGTYGLLWRFGTIFQFLAFALFDAWPVVFYNAQKEKNDAQLIKQLTTFYALLLICAALSISVASYAGIYWFLPSDYHYLAQLVPTFVLPLCLLEIARVLQCGFCLSTQTLLVPLLGLATLILKASLLIWLHCSLYWLSAASSCAFLLYAIVSAQLSNRSYTKKIIEAPRQTKLYFLLISYTGILHLLFYYEVSVCTLIICLATIPIVLWIIDFFTKEEKELAFGSFIRFFSPPHNNQPTISSKTMHTYSHNITNKSIAILGPCPPPLGGISVHIERVHQLLTSQLNNVSIFDTTKLGRYECIDLCKLALFLVRTRPDHVMYHTPYCGIKQLLLIVAMRKILFYNLILIEHDCRYLDSKSNAFKSIFNYALSYVDQLILIGKRTLESYQRNSISFTSCIVEPAFIPPNITQYESLFTNYPELVKKYIAHKKPLIVANAFQFSFIDGIELYGIDMCIELMKELVQTHPNVGLVVLLGQIGNENYYKKITEQIKTFDLTHSILFVQGNQILWPLFKHADLFIRPTYSDAHSISISEALHFNVPVITSDIGDRQDGCILFKNRDVDEFVGVVEDTLTTLKLSNATPEKEY